MATPKKPPKQIGSYPQVLGVGGGAQGTPGPGIYEDAPGYRGYDSSKPVKTPKPTMAVRTASAPQTVHRPAQKAQVPQRVRTAAGIKREAKPDYPGGNTARADLSTKLSHRAYLAGRDPATLRAEQELLRLNEISAARNAERGIRGETYGLIGGEYRPRPARKMRRV